MSTSKLFDSLTVQEEVARVLALYANGDEHAAAMYASHCPRAVILVCCTRIAERYPGARAHNFLHHVERLAPSR